jgi:transcriptional regulator with XRE-family HTH domain
LAKTKLVDQVFRMGLRGARLRFGADRGREMTPDELGDIVGKSGQTIRNYERGETEPGLNEIEELRVALRAPPEWPPFASYVPLESTEDPPAGGTQAFPQRPPGKPIADGAKKRKREGNG